MHRGESPEFIPYLLVVRIAPVVAETVGDVQQDLDVVASIVRRIECLAHALYSALGVGDGAV